MSIFESRLWISGRWEKGTSSHDVVSPFTQKKVGSYESANGVQIERILNAAESSFRVFRNTSRYIRSRLLGEMANGIETRRQALVERMVGEAGKPRSLAEIEVSRAVGTFSTAAEETKRYGGELLPVDLDSGGRSFSSALSSRVPRGPILGITPFNFPLNLVAHKVAPALAVGAPIILKPPPQAPGASQILGEVFESAAQKVSDSREGIPTSAFQIVQASNDLIQKMLDDERIEILSFTGSDKVGWMLRDRARKKKVVLELGGNAAAIVANDADLSRAAARIAFGGYAYSGQICISVQRVFVDASVFDSFLKLLIREIEALKVGDPNSAETLVGPVIDAKNKDRILEWVREAESLGAKKILGGKSDDNVLWPILMANVPAKAKLNCEEVFGPVVIVSSYRSQEEVFDFVNASSFGLQAGIFTDSQSFIHKAYRELEVGALIVNEIPTFRADQLPYGGVKNSGLGREGVRFAMEEFTELKTLISYTGPGGVRHER